MLRGWRRWRRQRKARRGQAFVEFSMVLILIMTILVGGVLVIQAIFMQQRLIDIVSRAAQWGAMTNSNEQINLILDEARAFSTDVQIRIIPDDVRQRPIGSKMTLEVYAQVQMLGSGISLTANLGARAVILVEHDPMRFALPEEPLRTLQLGDVVRVNTTAGESLNMRRLAGLAGGQFASLYKGDIVIIIDGPVLKDGLRWWRVEKRLQNSKKPLQGWCVDKADTVDTLELLGPLF